MSYTFNPLLEEGLQKIQETITDLIWLHDVDPTGLTESGRILVYNFANGMFEATVNVNTLSIDANVLHKNIAAEISSLANKATPVGADYLVIEDSNDTYKKKSILVSSLPIKSRIQDTLNTTYVDTLVNLGTNTFVSANTTTSIIAKFTNGSAVDVLNLDGNGNLFNDNKLVYANLNTDSIYLGTYRTTTTMTNRYGVVIGYSAGRSLTSATFATLIGYAAGDALTNQTENTFIGAASGLKSIGTYNVFIGDYIAAEHVAGGIKNVIIGANAGNKLINGDRNTIIGTQAGYQIGSSSDVVYIGYQTGYYNTVSSVLLIDNQHRSTAAAELTDAMLYGNFNVNVALQTLQTNSQFKVRYTGTGNGFILENSSAVEVFKIGYTGILYNETGVILKATGSAAAKSIYLGTVTVPSTNIDNSVYIGQGAGSTSPSGGSESIGIGRDALKNTTGSLNVAIGYLAGLQSSSGAYNTFLGASSGVFNISGSSNIYVGYRAGSRQTTNSNQFLIDNQLRATSAEELTNSIIYGVMAALPANQTLTFNAKTIISYVGTGNGLTIKNTSAVEVFKVSDSGLTQLGEVSNYVQLSKEKGTRYVGSTTVWKDMVVDLIGRRLNSSAGTVDYNYTENTVTFQQSGGIDDLNDTVHANYQINHEFKVGSNMVFYPHVHWFQQVTSNAVKSVVFTLKWRLQRNGYAKETAWNTITAEAGTADDVYNFTANTDGLYDQITSFDSITVTCDISDIFQIRMTRTDAETGNVDVISFDIHGEVDSDGSDAISSKSY